MATFPISYFHDSQARENKVNKPTISPKKIIKRRFSNDHEAQYNCVNNSKSRILKTPIKLKKQRSPHQLFGQKLPLNRIIETLDKESLQTLIMNIVSEHPQLTSDIINLSPDITNSDALIILQKKLQVIIDNMPYKVDASSDYSFLRVKPYVDDFFQSLSEYTLNYLPPIENDLSVSINFLKKFLLEIFPKLPKFQAVEFRYFYNLTIEKLSNIFESSISQFLSEKKQNILLIVNENWIEEFRKINEYNNYRFINTQHYLENEVSLYQKSGSVFLDRSEDSVDVSESYNENKLQGLNSILNFSSQNNPLNGSALGNVYDAI